MANLKHTGLFSFGAFQDGLIKTVGHNRQVKHSKAIGQREIIGTLHGHPVFRLVSFDHNPDLVQVTLDNCGWLTVTTVAAMKDFCRAAGVALTPSMAGGEMTAYAYDEGMSYGTVNGKSYLTLTKEGSKDFTTDGLATSEAT